MSAVSPLRPVVADDHRAIPRRCACTWTWKTGQRPWLWTLTVQHPSCPVHGPQSSTEGSAR